MLEVRHQVVPGRRRNVSGESGVASAGQPERERESCGCDVIKPQTALEAQASHVNLSKFPPSSPHLKTRETSGLATPH